MNARRETLICDTSFVSHLLCQQERPDRYPHWSIARIKSAPLAIGIVTVAELPRGLPGRWLGEPKDR
jgi:hypothetical protein